MADAAVKMRSTTTLNRFWDGADADRIRASEKFILAGRRICAHLLVQPDIAYAFMCDRALDDNGFLSRWLVSAPGSIAGSRFGKTISIKGGVDIQIFNSLVLRHLRRELPYAEGSRFELKPEPLCFSDEAAEIWWRFRDEVETALKPDGRFVEIKGLANKLPEHAARIAAVLAAFEEPERRKWPSCISEDAYAPIVKTKPPPKLQIETYDIERGIRLARYYAAEALRLRTAAKVSLELLNAQKLLDWLHAKWKEKYIAIAPLVTHGPGAFRETRMAKRLVGVLVDYGWLVPMEKGIVVDGKPRKDAWEIVKGEKR
jgi:hypothetical protein